ncbi:MAG: hypothetical protein H0V60_01490 [Actinobacteria bacterium]|nr:hypothetical protein [Actinomycetota bacterium]
MTVIILASHTQGSMAWIGMLPVFIGGALLALGFYYIRQTGSRKNPRRGDTDAEGGRP